MLIGLDLDNTLVNYTLVFQKVVLENNIVIPNWDGTKRGLKQFLLEQPNGMYKWQKLQGQVYGKYMLSAELYAGVANFLMRCQFENIPVVIVSHKTEFGHHDPEKISLRTQAIKWLDKQGFFSRFGLSKENVHFESTREKKINRMIKLNCTHFVDDLIEVFDEPIFPARIKAFLFSNKVVSKKGIKVCSNWTSIHNEMLGRASTDYYKYIAKTISNKEVLAATPITGRGNSQIHKVTLANGAQMMLKAYPDRTVDQRNRLNTEFRAFQFLTQNGVENTPKAIEKDILLNIGLYEWVDGEQVESPNSNHILESVDFIRQLKKLGKRPEAQKLPLASEACLSKDILFQQINNRYTQLQKIALKFPELNQFLVNQFSPLWRDLKKWSSDSWPKDTISQELIKKYQVLSPSDFGFHNAILKKNGTLTFIDFEYFGWDDPVKLIADFLWHPGMEIAEKDKKIWTDNLLILFKEDPAIKKRLEAAWPIYGLRWCLIILNEFRKDRWQNRVHARKELERADSLKTQLDKAIAICKFLKKNYNIFPYA